ncbi:MAG: phenylacetate--CoA ligase family protein [Chitinispirillaceae bacterium]
MDFRPELSWEFETVGQIESRSVRAVRNHVHHVKEISPYYRETLAGIDPSDIKSVQDIANLPTTDKSTLVGNIEKFWAVSPKDVAETVITSGSTGQPLVYFMTASDLDRLAFNEALSFHAAGVTNHDRAQLLVSLDRMFIAGMAYYRGLTTLGANTARVGVTSVETIKYYLELLKPTVLVAVPSFLHKLVGKLQLLGYDLENSPVEKIFCIGESIRYQDLSLNGLGEALERSFGARVFSTYGLTELAVAYCECEKRAGNHAHPELVYTEIVDENGNPVPEGTPGELVATPLGVEGVPLVRYRTGDITFKMSGTCECGRNSMRIGPILSRKSQMIKVKGTTLYPTTITSVLDELDCLQDYLIILEGNDALSDQVTIHAVTHPSEVITIADHLRAKARVSFPVLVSNASTINAHRGDCRKKVKILDKRNRQQ